MGSVCLVKCIQLYWILSLKDAKNNYAGQDIKGKEDEGEEEAG
jgi:hypothetical protein